MTAALSRRALMVGASASTVAVPAVAKGVSKNRYTPIEDAWREHDRRCGVINNTVKVAAESWCDYSRAPFMQVDDWSPGSIREFAALVLIAHSEGEGSALGEALIEIAHEVLA